jgi:hypothetical protein
LRGAGRPGQADGNAGGDHDEKRFAHRPCIGRQA